jgi:hypothetical protein
MVYIVSATFDEGGKVSSVRYTDKRALELALEYRRKGCTNVSVTVDGESYTLEEFQMIVG